MARRFEELEVWQESRKLTRRIYALTQETSVKRDWDLCRQIRRAAVSVMSNIAEGFERGSTKEFIHALYVARGSAGEVRSQLYIIMDVTPHDRETIVVLQNDYASLSRRIWSLIRYLQQRSDSTAVREGEGEYTIPADSSGSWGCDEPVP